MTRFGWIPDVPDPNDWQFEESLIAAMPAGTSAESIDFRAFDVPKVQISNSCVGQAVVAGAALSMAIRGTPIAFPSALFAYAGARLLAQPKQPLVDRGSSARLAMKWLREQGLVAESRWPEVSETINAVPPLDAFQEGESATVEAFYRIADGEGASDGIRTALRRGYCPVFAMLVDTKYEQIGREIYDAPGGEVLGGHMQTVVGCSAVLDALLVRNTWGPAFGDGGYAWIASSFINRSARDIWVIEAAPEVR